jgi:hypothetical protein
VAPAENEDRKRLERRLGKLAGLPLPRGPEGREIGTGDPTALLSALLTEVDETVLARRLAFRLSPDRPELRLDVYGGRITALAAPALPGLPPPQAALVGRTLAEDDAPVLRALLEGWLADAPGLWVAAQPAPPDRNPLALGLSARALALAWDVPLDTRPLPTEASALDALARMPCLAWLRRDAAGAETASGAPASVDRLREVAPPASGRPGCSVLGGEQGGAFLVLAEAGGESLRMLVHAGDLAAVTRTWRAAIG